MSDRPPRTLWDRLQAQTQHALSTGALQPIATDYEQVRSGGITFVVRILAHLAQKARTAKQKQDPNFNPFLPYDPDLYVGDFSETHLGLLNKFNVVDHHLLIVTREFESQQAWLTAADFVALRRCLGEVDGFAFYNAGPVAGASQRHKHLQVVPLPMVPGAPLLLPEQALTVADLTAGITRCQTLPFEHAIAPLTDQSDWLQVYRQLLQALEIGPKDGPRDENWQGEHTAPYNLLCTRRWMMAVPRRRDRYDSIAVNALGYAGSLLVKSPQQLAQLKAIGPMTVLRQAGVARF